MSVPAVHPPAQPDPSVQRVLVYRLGSLGDTLIALPCFHLVQKAFPDAQRRLLTNFPVSSKAPDAATVLNGSGLIHGYERYTVGTRSWYQLFKLVRNIRRFRPEVLVYAAASRGVKAARRDALFFRWICGIPRLVGVPLTQDMQEPREEAPEIFEPEAARLARNLQPLGRIDLNRPESWDMQLTPHENARADEELRRMFGKPFIALCIGTKVQAKDWGVCNWQALVERLAKAYPEHGLALIGAPGERQISEQAATPWRVHSYGPVRNLCGDLTPREAAAVLSRALLFLGHDSGPMHLAASVQTPCVAIFAARNKPRVWFPFGGQHRVIFHRVDCWGCGLETCIEQRRKCLLSITVEEVATAVMQVLPVTMEKKEA